MWKLISRGARESLVFERGGGTCLKREPVSATKTDASPPSGQAPVRVASSYSRPNSNAANRDDQIGAPEQKVTNCFWQRSPQQAQEDTSGSRGWWFDYKSICRLFCSTERRPTNEKADAGISGRRDDTGQRRRYRSLPYNFCDAWLGAVGYSGALIVGWVFSQHSECRWRNWYHNFKSAVISNTACGQKTQTVPACLSSGIPNSSRFQNSDYNDRSSRLKYTGLVHLLARAAISQPLVSKNAPNTRHGSVTTLGGGIASGDNQVVRLAYDSAHSENDDPQAETLGEQPIEFGPITAQQALEEAGNELMRVHNQVVGEVENREGVECMSRQEHRRASELFRRAASRIPGGYPPAAHNLAQCYELGLGTPQDYSKAARWYKRGADLGHAGSMYNLGVFYAHGWGGLEASTGKARALIKQAAALGHPDAIAALSPSPSHSSQNVERNDSEQSPIKDATDKTTCTSCNQSNEENPDDPVSLYNLAVSYEKAMPETSVDPYLILQMYQFASEKGHAEAKTKLRILRAYDAVGLLSEYLLGQKIHKSSSSDDYNHGISLVVDPSTSGSLT